MRSSTEDYKRPNKATDWVVTSYDGYSAHLDIVDGASWHVWVFLTKSKDPLIDILRAFMSRYGLKTGLVRTDQGGEFARSSAVCTIMLNKFGYVVKPTGADVLPRTAEQKYTTILWPSKSEHYFMVPDFTQGFGLQPFSMQSTFTIGSSTLPSIKPPMKHGTVKNLTSLI
jgi:hypothetical protein